MGLDPGDNPGDAFVTQKRFPSMLLLIPGPVTTDPRVRAAAAQDYAPWDDDFRTLVARLSHRVLAVAEGRDGEHVALPLPGSGHFAMEAAVRTFVPRGGKLLVPLTGQYAERLVRLATEAGRQVVPLPVVADQRIDLDAVLAALHADGEIGHVALVYSETATGIVHDVPAICEAIGRAGRRALVDAISAFGALPLDLGALPMVDSVAFTSNKCLEGLPGMSFTVARVDRLLECAGRAESWSLDLSDLYAHTLRAGPGTHRFTPAAQAIAALDVAMDLFDAEGGRAARLARYAANTRTLHDGVQELGLRPWLPAEMQGPIVVNVHAPPEPGWNLQVFVDRLKAKGVLISNFYNTPQPSIRVGCIGAVTPADLAGAVNAMGQVLVSMGLQARRAA